MTWAKYAETLRFLEIICHGEVSEIMLEIQGHAHTAMMRFKPSSFSLSEPEFSSFVSSPGLSKSGASKYVAVAVLVKSRVRS